jgi:predicted DNA-binding transcriptional regulator AlpA
MVTKTDGGDGEKEDWPLRKRKAKRKAELVPPTGIERLLSTEQVAAAMCVSVRTIRRRQDAGKMPPIVRAGRLVRWREGDIVAMIRGM